MTRIQLPDKALARSLYVLGSPGTGKSKALEGFMVGLIKSIRFSGGGVGLIDPAGELFDNLVGHIAQHGRRLFDRVVLVDPTDPDYVVGFNPLELSPGEMAERRAQFLATVITKIFHADPNITARMQRIMTHTFWLLIRFQLTLLDFAPVLTDPQLRAGLLLQLPPEDKLRRYWETEFPRQERLVTEWTQSSLNKVDSLVIDPVFRLMLGQQKSTINFRSILDEGKILLVKLPKGVLGAANSYLMGAFILAQIQLVALARAEDRYAKRRNFTLFIDEFQNYTTDDIHEIIAESRKYHLRLVMAHQYYEQLQNVPKLQAAVINTVGNLICFRLGAQDAELFMRDLFTPNFYQIKDIRKRRLPTGISWWPFMTEEEVIWMPVNEIWEWEARQLTQIPDRYFWYKRRGPYEAQLLKTADVPDPKMTVQLREKINQLRGISGQLYARSHAEVEREQHLKGHQDDGVTTIIPDALDNPFVKGLGDEV